MNFRIEQEIAIFEFDDGKANALGHELIEQFFCALDEAESQAQKNGSNYTGPSAFGLRS